MQAYDHTESEPRRRARWAAEGTTKTVGDGVKPKYYILDMFPYPSGAGLHVGHPKGYIGTDVFSRYKRMKGFDVLHPMGFDAFGLPAENYAIKNKVHPRVAVDANVAYYKQQLEQIGFDYDWSREVNTTDPAYYKWTQWIFLRLLEKGLAYESHEPINWCPSCQTGLANEDVDNGVCDRCGSVVEQKRMRQWVLRITDYADRLLADLDGLDWPESIKESQRNWIGRSEGAEFDFKLSAAESSADGQAITVFTTRADTLFGVTYVVLAPEHPLVATLAASASNKSDIDAYVTKAGAATEIERTAEGKEKTGVPIDGAFAINPANGEKVPVWVADYVLASYGTGAVMAVPAHDERDYAFATKYGLPIKAVIEPVTGTPMTDAEFRRSIVAIVENPKTGEVLCLDWGTKFGGTLFIGGGLEEGEDPAQCAIREVQEETGYKNLRVIRTTGISHHHYYAHSKKVARNIEVTGVHLELVDDEKVNTKLEETEQGKFAVTWLSKDEAEKRVQDANHALYFQTFIRDRVYTDTGIIKDSAGFDGQDSEAARAAITSKFGRAITKYKLREWVFSRQRYWGEPIPVIHCEKDGVVAVPDDQLPVVLPEVESYAPTGTGESPLADITDWVNTTCPKCGGPATRETNTMPQWAGSSWYYLRYMDPRNDQTLVDPKAEKYWSPVDLYVGGTEHATRHLIYARFWHKFLYDIGVVSTVEPFARLKNQGLIMAADGRKMSKSLGNVVNPDDIIARYGADTFRLFEMFLGPFEQAAAWSTEGIIGPRRFIERVWKLADKVSDASTASTEEVERAIHRAIKKVTEDIEAFAFNTAVSALMICVNDVEEATKAGGTMGKQDFLSLLKVLAPLAPHVTDELWEALGQTGSIHTAAWPTYDESKLKAATVTIAVQVSGKVRGTAVVPADADAVAMEAAARAVPEVAKRLEGATVVKVVTVPGRLVNLVLRGPEGQV